MATKLDEGRIIIEIILNKTHTILESLVNCPTPSSPKHGTSQITNEDMKETLNISTQQLLANYRAGTSSQSNNMIFSSMRKSISFLRYLWSGTSAGANKEKS